MNTYLKRSEIQYVHIELSIINHIFNIKFDIFIYKIKILILLLEIRNPKINIL